MSLILDPRKEAIRDSESILLGGSPTIPIVWWTFSVKSTGVGKSLGRVSSLVVYTLASEGIGRGTTLVDSFDVIAGMHRGSGRWV